jgi:hypothetical protein
MIIFPPQITMAATPTPAVQAPNQDHVDLLPAGGLEQFLAGFSSRRPGVHLSDLQRNRPPAASILAHGPILHRQRLLVIRRDSGIQSGSEHFRPAP